MRKTARAIAFAIGLLPLAALAQSAPANLPYHTLYGRLGAAPGDTGPGQAIPFSTVLPNIIGTQTANTVYAGPASGGVANPAFRVLVGADLPNPSVSTKGGVQSLTCAANQWLNAISVAGVPACAQPNFTNLAGSIAGSQIPSNTVTFAMLATAGIATGAQLRAGTASELLAADIIFDAEQTITFNATQTLDFSTFLNGRITLTGNITSLTCSNIKASQSGTITLVQDGTGTRTMVAAWCTQFRWASGSRGVLSTAINTVDALFYQCVTTAICYVSLAKAQAN